MNERFIKPVRLSNSGDVEDSPVRRCELFELVPPRVPVFGETVQTEHQWVTLVTCLHVMNAYILFTTTTSPSLTNCLLIFIEFFRLMTHRLESRRNCSTSFCCIFLIYFLRLNSKFEIEISYWLEWNTI